MDIRLLLLVLVAAFMSAFLVGGCEVGDVSDDAITAPTDDFSLVYPPGQPSFGIPATILADVKAAEDYLGFEIPLPGDLAYGLVLDQILAARHGEANLIDVDIVEFMYVAEEDALDYALPYLYLFVSDGDYRVERLPGDEIVDINGSEGQYFDGPYSARLSWQAGDIVYVMFTARYAKDELVDLARSFSP